MSTLDRRLMRDFVNEEIAKFHQNRLDALRRIKLDLVLRKKNPYLFRARNFSVAGDFVEAIMTAFLSSSEEEIFGAFLEELAIFISEQTCGGRKSTATGLDLEFDRESTRYLVAIKSGPNWGNSSQYAKLEDNFKKAVAVQRQSHRVAHVQPVLGICYGKSPAFTDKGTYWKIIGQRFWHFLSGDENLYVDIIEPIGYEAERRNADFEDRRADIQKKLTAEFMARFCNADSTINWHKLVAFNSGNLADS